MKTNVTSVAVPAFTCLLICAAASAAIQGVALANRYFGDPIWQNRGVLLINTATGELDTLVPLTTSTSGPCFSPDGTRIAVIQGGSVKVIYNDGSHVETICALDAGGRPNCLSWPSNGWLYWSDATDKIYRANVTTKTKEIFARMADFTGTLPTVFEYLKMSLDATRGGSMVNGSSEGSFGIDFSAMTVKSFGSGCQGTVSPNGLRATRNTGGALGYSYHQVAYIHDFSTSAILDTIIAPGAAPGQTGSMPRFVFHRFSHSSNDHVVFTGEDLISNEGYVHCLSTNETAHLGRATVFDFWSGTLPSPPVDGPRLSLTPASLSFTSTNGDIPAAKTVTVTNTGIGTLTAVTLQNKPSWLTVTGMAAGNTQVLSNTASPAGLAPGAYNATITVTGGGATNSVNYTVTFNVGVSINTPTGLQASAVPPSSIALTWTDNSANENGFSIECRAGTGAWVQAGTTAANATSFTDTGLNAGDYTYRVRAGNGADSSGYSNEASAVLAVTRSITVTAPHSGDNWPAGSVQHIQWTTHNVGNVVLNYTPDRGETIILIGDSAVAPSDPEYGNYPWTVPAIQADSIQILIYEYGNLSMSALSGCFTISSSAAAPRHSTALPRTTSLRNPGVFASTGSRTFTCDLAPGDNAEVRIYRFDGVLAAVVPVPQAAGTHAVKWDSRMPGAMFIARLHTR